MSLIDPRFMRHRKCTHHWVGLAQVKVIVINFVFRMKEFSTMCITCLFNSYVPFSGLYDGFLVPVDDVKHHTVVDALIVFRHLLQQRVTW